MPTNYVDQQMQEEEANKLRQQGVPEDLIKQLLTLSVGDPSALTRQYEAASWLRRAATDPNYAKSMWHIPAQAMAGMMVGKKDKEYSKALRDYQGQQASARQNWFSNRYPRPQSQPTGQVTPKPDEEEVYPD